MSLGGGSGGGTTRTVQQLTPEQQAILNPITPILTKFGQTPLQQFPFSTIPGFNPFETAGQQAAAATAAGVTPSIGNALNFQNFLFGPALSPEANPGLQGSIDAAIRPLTETFTQKVLPNIRLSEGLAGQAGGSRGRVLEGLATRDLLRQVGDTSANLVNANFQNALQQATRGLAFAPSVLQSSLLPTQLLSSVGQQARQLQTQQLLELAQRFGQQQLLAFSPAQAAANVAFGFPGGVSNTRSDTSSSASPLSTVAGLGLLGSVPLGIGGAEGFGGSVIGSILSAIAA